MYISTATITSKGQISLPKKIRDILNSYIVSIEVNEKNQVVLSPIHDLAGSLSEYKQNSNMSFDEIRKQAWMDNSKNLNQKIKSEF
jgi:bifunctional DNA-binding transcriptional regulator/antitoxin component of YhaV-PrlF toxin-antitoxin module